MPPAIIENINVRIEIKITGVSASALQTLSNAVKNAIDDLKITYPNTTADMTCTVPVNIN